MRTCRSKCVRFVGLLCSCAPVLLCLVEKRVGQVKNMIIDTVEMAAGVVDIMKENPVNGILNSQKRPQSLEIMKNENLMKYTATVSKEHGNKKYAETDQFSLSDVDTTILNLEKEIEDYEMSIREGFNTNKNA